MTQFERNYKQDMLDSMPDYYAESPEVHAIIGVAAAEIERKHVEADDLLAQLYVSTATWGLDYWERVLALPPKPRASLRSRRNRILARLNGTAPATVRYLTDVVNAHVADKSARIVEYSDAYRFEAEIGVGNPIDMTAITRDMNEVKPAHLAFGIVGVNYCGAVEVDSEQYVFDAPYKKTNRFHTDLMDGRKSEVLLDVVTDNYVIDVDLPLTNVMQTDSIHGFIGTARMAVVHEVKHMTIERPICGAFYASEGVV